MANPNLNLTISRLSPLFQYLTKQRENKKFRKSLEITGTFILIIIFLLFAIKPTALTISALVGEIKSKELLKQEMRQKIENLVKAQNSYALLQEKYYLLDSALPSRPYYAPFYETIATTATSSGLSLTKANFNLNTKDDPNLKSVKTNTRVGSLTLPLSVKSENFDSLQTFFSYLINRRRLTYIPQISFSLEQNTKSIESSPSATSLIPKGIIFSTSLNGLYWSSQINNEK